MFRKKSSARGCIHLRCLAEMISMVVLVKFWNCYVTFMIQMNTFLNIFDHWAPMCGGVGRCQLRCVVSILGVLLRWSPWSCSWSSGIVIHINDSNEYIFEHIWPLSPNVRRCREMSTAMCCIHLGCLAEMISLVVLVKFGNCYVRVLMSTCRQIDALENRKTDHTSVIIWHSSSL